MLLESEPQSNKYRQVALNPDQFLALSNTLGDIMGEKVSENHIREGSYQLIEEEVTLPEKIQDFYEE